MIRPLLLSSLLAAALAVAGPVFPQDTTGIGAVTGDRARPGTANPRPASPSASTDTDRCADVGGRRRRSGSRASASGQQHIEVRAPGLPPYVSGHVDVRAGFDARVEVALPQIDAVTETVTVTAPAFTPPEEVKTSGFILSARDINAWPPARCRTSRASPSRCRAS